MNNFHPNFPFGKGIWIHDIPNCEKGNIQAIIDKCKAFSIDYLLIKSADGANCYPNNENPQLSKDITDQFHANGIKVYSWSYIYGLDPKTRIDIVQREADLALWSLEQLGVDGHIFDAETEYETLTNNVAAAEKMFGIVRAKHPEAFLAHAPYPYIKYHTNFPYVTFGKYCDAVMPQLYWGTIGVSVSKMVQDMFDEWSSWQDTWIASGHGDAVKPIIPLGQGYDNIETNYVLTPSELADFITRIYGYGSVNFWVWELLLREDLWVAIKNTQVKPKEAFGIEPSNSQNAKITPSGAPILPMPAIVVPQDPTTAGQSQNQAKNSASDTVNQTENTTQAEASNNSTPIDLASNKTNIVVAKAPLNPSGKTTITVAKNPAMPSGVEVKFVHHKPHIDYVIDFFTAIFHAVSSLKDIRIKKGGDSK